MRSLSFLLLSILLIAVFYPYSGSSSDDGSGPVVILEEPTRSPFLNFTYLENGAFGSTAYRVTDGNVVIYIEAFPGSAYCKLKPYTVSDADIIIQESHGHGTHYDASSVYKVQNNSDAYVVGNSPVINDMKARNVSRSKLIEMNPSTTSKVTRSIADLNVNITAYSMPHTQVSGTNVVTFLIEMPNGLKWFHGTCYSDTGSDKEASMKSYAELKDLEVMLVDFDHNFGKIESFFKPMIIGRTHDYSSSPYQNDVWLDYPSKKVTLSHGDSFLYPQEWLPKLLNADVSPSEGDQNTEFNFTITMKYRTGTPPTSARIDINGVPHDLTSAGNNYREGVEFYYNTKLEPNMMHEVNFEFIIDGKEYSMPFLDLPDINSIPVLGSESVTPMSGDNDMDYQFSVVYTDLDDDPAIKSSIIIDGNEIMMRAESSDPISGIEYAHTTKLSIGEHLYHFIFSDGKNQIRYPMEGEFSGPEVVRANYAPVLSNGRFDPIDGNRDTQFGFAVKYKDSHGDEPTIAKVFIDGNPFNMTKKTGDPRTGAEFVFSSTLDLGSHQFHFEFSDGEFNVRFPVDPSEELIGPVVLNRAPVIDLELPSEYSEFRDDELILFDASNSTDMDGDDLSYTWTSNIDGLIGNEAKFTSLLSEGQHMITLLVEDPFEGSAEFERSVFVTHYEVVLMLELTLDPDDPEEGEDSAVIATIRNAGNENSGSLILEFLLDDENIRSASLPSLVAGQKKEFEALFTSTAGDHMIKVIINDMKVEYLNFTVAERTPPVAYAGQDMVVELGDQATLDATGSQYEGVLQLISWDLDDGSSKTGMIIEHKYELAGTYNVSLTIKDDLGKISTDVVMVTVKEPYVEPIPSGNNKESGIGIGAVIGISTIVLVLIAGLIVLILLVIVRKRKDASITGSIDPQTNPTPQTPPAGELNGLIGSDGTVQNNMVDQGPINDPPHL